MVPSHVPSPIPRDEHDEAETATEMHNLQETPRQPPARQLKTKKQITRQFLCPAAAMLLLCIGGPILLYELSAHRLYGYSIINNNYDLKLSKLACDIQEPWTSWVTLFEINIRTGNLSFTNAKIIDLAFDLVDGRGGQAFLAWIAYRVYTDVLTRLTENGQIRYDLFAAITLHPNDAKTLQTATVSVPSANNLWAKFALVWTILAMLYVLSYPTLVSAATSLVGASTTSVQLHDNATAPITEYVTNAAYSFAGNGVDGKPDPWIVPVADINTICGNTCDIMYLGDHEWSVASDNTIVVDQITYTVSNNTKTTCGFYYDSVFYPAIMEGNDASSYVTQYFPSQVICIPDGQNYQWGASWEILVLILCLQIIWSASMLLMWWQVTIYSPLVRQERKMGTWRAILDLARPLLARLGPGDGMYNQDQLEDSVRKMPPVHYETKSDEIQDGGCRQNVHLVAGFDGDDPLLP